jgi:hypothetical protein
MNQASISVLLMCISLLILVVLVDLGGVGTSTYVDPVTAAGDWKSMVDTIRSTNPSAKFHSPGCAEFTDNTWNDVRDPLSHNALWKQTDVGWVMA